MFHKYLGLQCQRCKSTFTQILSLVYFLGILYFTCIVLLLGYSSKCSSVALHCELVDLLFSKNVKLMPIPLYFYSVFISIMLFLAPPLLSCSYPERGGCWKSCPEKHLISCCPLKCQLSFWALNVPGLPCLLIISNLCLKILFIQPPPCSFVQWNPK